MTRRSDASQFQCLFPACKCAKQVSHLVIWTLRTCISGFEHLGMTLTSAVTTLIRTLLCML